MAQVNFRVDDSIKKKAEIACKAMGLSMSTAINIFLTKIANEQRIPFEVSADPFYSKENMERLKKRISDINAGKNIIEREIILDDYEEDMA